MMDYDKIYLRLREYKRVLKKNWNCLSHSTKQYLGSIDMEGDCEIYLSLDESRKIMMANWDCLAEESKELLRSIGVNGDKN
jgi:hypothetical protein